MAAALGFLGGLGGFASTISTIGTIVGTVGSIASAFSSRSSPAYQVPAPVVLPPAAPMPSAPPEQAATLKDMSQASAQSDYLRRTRLKEKKLTVLNQKVNSEGDSETRKPTLLGS